MQAARQPSQCAAFDRSLQGPFFARPFSTAPRLPALAHSAGVNTVVIDDKVGGNGVNAAQEALRGGNDGCTVFVGSTTTPAATRT